MYTNTINAVLLRRVAVSGLLSISRTHVRFYIADYFHEYALRTKKVSI